MTLWAARGLADEPKAIDLEWNAADGCPDRAEAEAAIREIVGQRTVTDADLDLVKVDIAQRGDGRWEARIVTHGAAGTGLRRFEGASCKRVTEATILIVAMTLDPMGVAEQITDLRGAADRGEATPRAAEGPAVMIGARAMADLGSLPSPTLGVAGVLGIQSGPAHFEGEATVWLPRLAASGATQGSGGEIGLYTGGFRGCLDVAHAFRGELRSALCLGGEAGTSTGKGFGFVGAARSSGIWAAGLAGVSVREVSASGLTFWMSVEVGVPIRRHRYFIDNSAVFQASPVVGRASFGLAWVFR